MVQPYNYSLNIRSPGEAFMQGIQMGQAGRAMQAQAEEQRRLADKNRRLNEALAKLGPNARYEDYMAQVDANPDLADILLGQQKTFSDARKNALFSAGEDAFMLLRPDATGAISPDAAIAKLEEKAQAFENSRQPDIAKQLRDAAQGIKINPAAARNTLGTMLAFSDADKFKKINDAIGQSELTSFQKDLAAGGVDPNSEEGRRKARQYADLKVDPIVEMETPSGGKFVGRESVYFSLYGSDAEKPQPKALPKVGDVRGGYEFTGGDPSDQSNWVKVKGGQAATPPGTFSGQ